MNKFILGEDPIPNDRNEIYIISVGFNKAHIRLYLNTRVKGAIPNLIKEYIGTNGVREYWTLAIEHFFTTNMNAEMHGKIIDNLLNDAWEWYKSYLQWEDGNIENEDKIKLN